MRFLLLGFLQVCHWLPSTQVGPARQVDQRQVAHQLHQCQGGGPGDSNGCDLPLLSTSGCHKGGQNVADMMEK